MQNLVFDFHASRTGQRRRDKALVGYVGSGNLEVLVEATNRSEGCRIDVATSAIGFEEIWRAVLTDFAERHEVAGLDISINDGGARPDTVALRLAQALAAMKDQSS